MRVRPAAIGRLGLTPAEYRILARLSTPAKIQAFIDAIPQNFEPDGDSCLTVRGVLAQRRAHCIEGAFVAACAFWIAGEPPLLMDLRATRDYDHVVALYRRNGLWGAISKTNGIYLRSRDPVYRTLRELAMSWAHEYGNRRHQKTLREYSVAVDLSRADPEEWITGKDAWNLANRLDGIRHHRLLPRRAERNLSLFDALQREGTKLLMYRKPVLKKKSAR